MTSDAEYSTDANGVRTVNKTSNMRSLSLIRDHGRIKFDLVRENEETYAKKSAQRNQDSRMMYKCIRDSLTKEGLAKISIRKMNKMFRR